MLNEVSKLLLYSDLGGDSILENLAAAIAAKDSGADDRDTTIRKIYTEIKRLLDLSTSYGFDTNLWQNYLTFLLITNENSFSLTSERKGVSDGGSVNVFAKHDFRIFKNLFFFPIETVVITLFLKVLIPVTTRAKLTYGGSTGLDFTKKQIVALANAPLETGIGNIAELGAAVSDLADCAAGNIVMSGMIVRELTASSTVTMEVERLAAKVGVSQISTAFELDQHKQMTFDIKAIYLINVAGEKAYLDQNEPSKWYNLGRHEAGNTLGFLRDDVASGVVAAGSSYTKEHYFYCYPNLTDTKTRLVVEAMVGGYTYYYPVTLDAVDANTSYDYNLTITRLGSDSPDVPVEEGTVTFTVTVKDWVQQNVNETI